MSGAGIIERASQNLNDRPSGSPVDILVLHYTGMKSGRRAPWIASCDPAAQVSAHYLIDEDGAVYRLVDESAARLACRRLGLARPRATSMPARSGSSSPIRAMSSAIAHFPAAQMAALTDLVTGDPRPPPDPAPQRRRPFRRRPRRASTTPANCSTGRVSRGGHRPLTRRRASRLKATYWACSPEYGYDIGARAGRIAAFQRHFRPAPDRRQGRRGDPADPRRPHRGIRRARIAPPDAEKLTIPQNCIIYQRPDGRMAAFRHGESRRREESPGSTETRCRVTPGGGDPRESATESKPPGGGMSAAR